jgi:hypothetical protein
MILSNKQKREAPNCSQQLQVNEPPERRGFLYRIPRAVLPVIAFALAISALIYTHRRFKSDADLQVAGNETTSCTQFFGEIAGLVDLIISWSGPISLSLTASVIFLFLYFARHLNPLEESGEDKSLYVVP